MMTPKPLALHSQHARRTDGPSPSEGLGAAQAAQQTLREATRDFQRSFIQDVLAEERWNITRAARRLGLSRSHLYALLHALSIEPVRQ